jgi:hypothetical protein
MKLSGEGTMHPMSADPVHTTSGNEGIPLPAVPETYGFPIATRAVFVVGALLCTGLAVAAPWIWPGEERLWIGRLFFLGFGVLAALCAWMSQQHVVVDAQGITWRGCGRAARQVAWNELRQARERSTAQILEVHGLPGAPAIKIPFIYKDFARLRGIICQAAANASALQETGSQGQLPATFEANRAYFVVVYIMAALMLVGAGLCFSEAVRSDKWGALGGCLALALFFGGMGAFRWHALTVESDRIVLKALLRLREIPLAEVASAEIETVVLSQAGIASGARMHLVILFKNGKRLNLGSLQETMRARDVIEAARRAAGETGKVDG